MPGARHTVTSKGDELHPTQNRCKRVNSLLPNEAMWRHRSGSTMVQIMVCRLSAPSHSLVILCSYHCDDTKQCLVLFPDKVPGRLTKLNINFRVKFMLLSTEIIPDWIDFAASRCDICIQCDHSCGRDMNKKILIFNSVFKTWYEDLHTSF